MSILPRALSTVRIHRALLQLATVAILALVCPVARADNQLRLETQVVSTDGSVGFEFSTPVLISNDFGVRGYTVIVTTSDMEIAPTGISTAGSVTESAGAESVLPTIEPNGILLQVELDSAPPFDGQLIPIGADEVLVTLIWETAALVVEPTGVSLAFEDGALGSPPAFNHLLDPSGLPFGTGLGLLLEGTTVFLLPGQVELSLDSGTIPPGDSTTVPVFLDNAAGALDAFVLAIGHPPEITLLDITLEATDTIGASPEFVSSEIQTSGGIVTVIFDFEAPLEGNALPAGSDLVLARLTYACSETPVFPDVDQSSTIDFVDGVLGFPPADNTLTIAGLSVPVPSSGGTITCEAFIPPNASFAGGRLEGGSVVPAEASAGTATEYTIFYTEPNDSIEALQIAFLLDSQLTLVSTSLDLTGTASEATGAEFVSTETAPEPGGGTYFGCDLFYDVLPPFGGQTLPVTESPLALGRITVSVAETAVFGELLPVTFVDWTTDEGMPFTNEVLIANDETQAVAVLSDGAIEVALPISFLRSDCNNDSISDIGDAIRVLDILFFDFGVPVCPPACDINADTVLDIADYIYLISFLFLDGNPPPAPFPTCGSIDGFICAEANCP